MAPDFALIKTPWHFPVVLHFWNWSVPVHPVCDLLAYGLGFRFYLHMKKHSSLPQPTWEQSALIFIGCIFGAIIGAKLLAWSEAPALYWALRNDPNFWFGGKTIVGGLLGGWVGIEIAKKALGITSSTGDVCVYPLILGMCIGRIGCFLTGLSDNTCGLPTQLPWARRLRRRHPAPSRADLRNPLSARARHRALAQARLLHRRRACKFRWFMVGYLVVPLLHRLLQAALDALRRPERHSMGLPRSALVFCVYSLMKLSEQPAPENSHG